MMTKEQALELLNKPFSQLTEAEKSKLLEAIKIVSQIKPPEPVS